MPMRLTLGTILVATALALGGVLTGATQRGGLRASTATVAAGSSPAWRR